MKPTIDFSILKSDAEFKRLDQTFGLFQRFELYQVAKNEDKALITLNGLITVLTNGEDFIVELNISHAAGNTLALLEYAKLTIEGRQPEIPFNAKSTESHLVLMR